MVDDLVESVCLLGAESTGKTTLSAALAKVYGTQWADEYGRTLWVEKGGKLEFEDLLRIAEVHVAQEEALRRRSNRFLIVDTSPLTTLFYCLSQFGRADPKLYAMAKRAYDHIFLCMPDFPLVQDGTRSDEAFRARQHQWYLDELTKRRIPYTPLYGAVEARLATVLRVLDQARSSIKS